MHVDEAKLDGLQVRLLMRFGSQARGEQGPNSDVDIGVLFAPDADCTMQRLQSVRDAIVGAERLDLVCLNDANALLLKEVATDAELVFEYRPGTIERFRLMAFKRYMDTAKFRRAQAEALRSRFG